MKCLYCGEESEVLEYYEGVPIRVCKEKHRTGIYKEEIPFEDKWDWLTLY